MSTEAHKLIGISLSKIAQSRASRGGVSLHKNLLVATVLHKARYIFMEEAYQIVHGGNKSLMSSSLQESPFNYKIHMSKEDDDSDSLNDNSASDLKGSELSENTTKESIKSVVDSIISESTDNDKLLCDISDDEWRDSGEERQEDERTVHIDTEATGDTTDSNNYSTFKNPPSYQAHIELTYLNLDKCTNSTKTDHVLSVSEITENNNNLKRKHSEWEVEEAVLSILPKRSKSGINSSVSSTSTFDESSASNTQQSDTDFTFLDESDFLSETPLSTTNSRICDIEESDKMLPASMEIDRLSSLVSIFSFANLTEMSGMCEDDNPSVNKSHSVVTSSPDQCSTQAKDTSDVLQPMPSFLAMTV